MEALIITFKSTWQALDAEDFVKEKSLPARIIPVPGSLQAGCGMCLWAREGDLEWWQNVLETNGIAYERIRKGNFL